jgi:hypothetical protein
VLASSRAAPHIPSEQRQHKHNPHRAPTATQPPACRTRLRTIILTPARCSIISAARQRSNRHLHIRRRHIAEMAGGSTGKFVDGTHQPLVVI